MKNKVLILFFLGINTLNAQTLNIKIGPAFSKMHFSANYNRQINFDEIYTGIAASFKIDYLQKKFFYLSSNFGFINIGGKGYINTNFDGHVLRVYTKTSLNYLTLNSRFYFKFIDSKKISPFIGIGPRLDYLIHYRDDQQLIYPLKEGLNKSLYGLDLVAGTHYSIKNFQLGVEIEYNHVFNKLVSFPSPFIEGLTDKISVGYCTIGFLFGYKLK
ncbi:MAG TPA: hypothetical protein PKW80_05935 [Bacteroidales bacterium]|nr:hypothetical protein [Bacteroidales bacterium]